MNINDLINYTPHAVALFNSKGLEWKTITSHGTCRVVMDQKVSYIVSHADGAFRQAPNTQAAEDSGTCLLVMNRPTPREVLWSPSEAPAREASVIVSVVAAPIVAEQRPDLAVFVPDTGPKSVLRSDDGRISGVKRLILWHDPHAGELAVVTCYNIANPYDGWQVEAHYRRDTNGLLAAVDAIVDTHQGDMIDDPPGQPFDPPKGWLTMLPAEKRRTAQAILADRSNRV